MKAIRFALLTISDKGFSGVREDKSGPAMAEFLQDLGEVVLLKILPDERALIAKELMRICDEGLCDIILTSGGTGLAPRDVTPEATLDAAERLVPGLGEAMRANSLTITNRAMLSRAIAATRKKTLIVNLPGSPKAVRECLAVIGPVFGHAVETLRGEAYECATPQ